VAGAGALAQETGTDPAQLRRDVTSPNGTTQAGLEVLMDEARALPLIRRTVRAAAARSEELGRG
jgi:pyrroline-5-carboxylate reductase